MLTRPIVRLASLILLFIFSLFMACRKGDSTKNLPPGPFDISVIEIKHNSVLLGWTEATDPEGKEVKYTVSLGTQTYSPTGRTIQISGLTENKKYEITVTASDPEGEKTKSTLSFTTAEPSTPAAFEVSMTDIGGSVAAIKWTAAHLPDSSAIKYDVYLNDNLVKQNLADTVLHFEFNKLKELTNYTAKVVARSSYNKTQESTKTFTTNQDPAPTGLTLQIKQVSYSFMKFSFGKATDAEGQAITYSVWLDNTDVTTQLGGAITPGKEYALRALTAEKNYKLTIKATDEASKSGTVELPVSTLKKPTVDMINNSITNTADGFIFNFGTNVDYKPSKIILQTTKYLGDYGNIVTITTQPTTSSVTGGNRLSCTYPNSVLPTDGDLYIRATLYWGDDTEFSTAGYEKYTYYNFKPTSVSITDAAIDASLSRKTYTIHFKNSLISPYENFSIIEVVFGTQKVQFSTFLFTYNTGYVTGFADAQFAAIDAGPRTGYLIMKDTDGYHKLDFTFTYR
jgi:hypothetical protein